MFILRLAQDVCYRKYFPSLHSSFPFFGKISLTCPRRAMIRHSNLSVKESAPPSTPRALLEVAFNTEGGSHHTLTCNGFYEYIYKDGTDHLSLITSG